MTLRNWRGRPKVLMGETLAYASALALPFPVPPCVMDANSILNRLRDLRWEIRELQELNTRYRSQQRPSPAETKARELGCSRMAEIKAGLTTTIESRYSHATISIAKRKLATRMPGTLPLIRYSPHAANSVSNAWAWLWAFAGNNASRLGSYCGETLGGTCAQWVFLCEVCGETCTTPSRFLDMEGLNSLNWMPWSRVHCCKYTSMPRPPPPKAYTSERSSTTIRASVCEVTASRNLKASLPTILPLHSTTAKSLLMLSICMLSITSSQRCSVALKHERCHRFASCILCWIRG